MALAAEIRYIFGRKILQFRRKDSPVSLRDRGKMSARVDMAMLAGESRLQRSQIQLVADNRVTGMATEARRDTFLEQRPANRLLQGLWLQSIIPHGESKPLYRWIVTDQALIHPAIMVQKPGLRLCAH